MLKSKTIKIGEMDVNIVQLDAFEVLNIRKELVGFLKSQIGDDISGTTGIIKALASLIYELPAEFYLKLFKNCSALDIGELSNRDNFKKAFNDNLDGVTELAAEVLNFNGFFTLNTISVLAKKFPILAPMESAVSDLTSSLKK